MRAAFIAAAVLAVAVSAQYPTYCGRSPFDADAQYSHPAPLTVDAQGNALSLVQVQVLHRHGDRTSTQGAQCWVGDTARYECPLEASTMYLTDAKPTTVPRLYRKYYKADVEITPGDCFVGQLTTQGHEQHIANGQDLRRAYVDTGFLSPESLRRGDLHLRTTDVPRTVQSISALLEGMFPAAMGPDGRTEVVDIETRDSAQEDMVPQSAAWIALNEQASKSPGFEQLTAQYAPAMEAIMASVNTTLGFDSLSDCVNAHVCHGYPIPFNQSLFDTMTLGTTQITYYVYTWPTAQQAGQVGMGPYYATVLDRLTGAVNGGGDGYKMYIDSGHDSSVMPFIAGLQASDGLWASYAVYTTIELYAVSPAPAAAAGSSEFDGALNMAKANANAKAKADAGANYAVRFVYRGKDVQLPYCAQTLCTWAEFSAYVQSLVPPKPRTAREAASRMRVSGEIRDAAMRLF